MHRMRDPKKYGAARGALGAFLYGVARNRVMKHRERLPREIPLEEKNEDGTGGGIVLQDASTPAMWAEKRERMQQVRAAVLDLPMEFREAVVLCELEEMSYEEAAQMAGCPIGTIRLHLLREFRTHHVTFKVRRAAVVAAWALAAAAGFAGVIGWRNWRHGRQEVVTKTLEPVPAAKTSPESNSSAGANHENAAELANG